MTEYGNLKVGDSFSCELLNEWTNEGPHKYYKEDTDWEFGNIWLKEKGMFFSLLSNKRSIESFEELDGHIGFLVSNTVGVYLCAEGFEEFVNNQKLKDD